MTKAVAVIGAGSWGTTVAHLTASHSPVRLWARRPELAAEINAAHTNSTYLSGFGLSSEIAATTSLQDAVAGAEFVVVAVPSHGFREILSQLRQFISAETKAIVSLTKGFEPDRGLRMTEVIEEVIPNVPTAVLTGPNLAREIMAGQAAASVVATTDQGIATELQALFSAPSFRVYTHHDVVGAEMGGALKNVIAIAAGMADGLAAGDNARAAVITRGLAEITRLGVAMGGDPLTFSGLAGLGDLVATSISAKSRNRHVGEQLGLGRALSDVMGEMDMVAEGVKAAPIAVELAERYDVEMPIAVLVTAVCAGECSALEAYEILMARSARPEIYGLDR